MVVNLAHRIYTNKSVEVNAFFYVLRWMLYIWYVEMKYMQFNDWLSPHQHIHLNLILWDKITFEVCSELMVTWNIYRKTKVVIDKLNVQV